VKAGLTNPVFPPDRRGSVAGRENGSIRWSLWREQGVRLSVVVYGLLTSLHLMFSPHTFRGLPFG
jgi:hypothetical protein